LATLLHIRARECSNMQRKGPFSTDFEDLQSVISDQ
jgi:hypothetical protein